MTSLDLKAVHEIVDALPGAGEKVQIGYRCIVKSVPMNIRELQADGTFSYIPISDGGLGTSLALIGVGVLTLICGIACLLMGKASTDLDKTRFWAVLLHDSVFFTFITAVSIFVQAAVSLAQGGWLVAYRRVPEAIGANVWIFGSIAAKVNTANMPLFRNADLP